MLYEQPKAIDFNRQRYISGQKALNIHDYTYHTGDWHAHAAWSMHTVLRRFNVMGDGETYNTNPYLDDLEIYDATETLKRMGKPIEQTITAASHARAIVDMVICNALED